MSSPIPAPILFMAESATLAHVVRLLTLADSLELPRSSIHFATASHYRNWIEARGMSFVPLQCQDTGAFQQKLDQGRSVIDKHLLSAQVKEDIEILNSIRPQIVVGDFRLSLAISARSLHIPYLGIANSYWTRLTPGKMPLPELSFLKPIGRSISELLFKASRELIVPHILQRHADDFNIVRAQYGMTPYRSIIDAYTDADWIGFADASEVVTPSSQFGSRYTMLGPLNGRVDCPQPSWWNELNDDQPIVYLNLGSSGKHELAPLLIEALSELPIQIIAGSIEPTERPISYSSGAKLFSARVLPGDAVCQKAQVVICNGGAPSSYQALAAGRPVIGITRNMDQALNMQSMSPFSFVRTFSAWDCPLGEITSCTKEFMNHQTIHDDAQAFKTRLLAYDHKALFKQALMKTVGDQKRSPIYVQ
ncbi:MAG: hypothetical protein JNJ49_14395 [Bdellovibrionaceae bacterium]|nr:hypothetical protein [Pseudobdellovibrionaceae bacterium]